MGAPIEIIIPEEGIGWEMQAMSIMTGTKNPSDAKTFIDWAISNDANTRVPTGRPGARQWWCVSGWVWECKERNQHVQKGLLGIVVM
jgi:spermidine/putrescine-binding protein